MEIRVRVADPAGNITIFVMSPLKRSQYAEVANQLLAMEEFHGEQVGFVEEKEDGTLHMQMMGGEFCGNATRSFGFLESMLDENHPLQTNADVSGSSVVLKVEADLEKGTSRTAMPLPEGIADLEVKGEGCFPMVIFHGISHVIISGPRREDGFVSAVLEAAARYRKCDAYGVMFLEPQEGNTYRLTPVVYVAETDSLIWESSCGSGSMASAVYLARDEKDGRFVYELHQPGGLIEAAVEKNSGSTVQCHMGGPVTISEEVTVDVEA